LPEEVVILNVGGISCEHCANRIMTALKSLNGVVDVIVSLKDKKVTVEYNYEKIDLETIKAVIEDNGYEVK